MVTLANNAIFISVVGFAAGLAVFGLLNIVKSLKEGTSMGQRILASIGAAFGGALVTWFAVDFLTARSFLGAFDGWMTSFLSEEWGTIIIK